LQHRHREPRNYGSCYRPDTLNDEKPTGSGNELALADRVIHMSHNNAVGRNNRATEKERAGGYSTSERAKQSEGRLSIKLPQINSGPCDYMGGRHGPSQSDWHRGDCDNNRDYAERSEAGRVGRRQKELTDYSG
jgi:hypothetical protein